MQVKNPRLKEYGESFSGKDGGREALRREYNLHTPGSLLKHKALTI